MLSLRSKGLKRRDEKLKRQQREKANKQRRVRAEFERLNADDSLTGILLELELMDADDWLNWKVCIAGPVGTPYEGGKYYISIQFDERYPMSGPKFQFLTRIYHPNIDIQSTFGCPFLRFLWRPMMTISQPLMTLFVCMSNGGNPIDPEVQTIGLEMRENLLLFMKNAVEWNHKYAGGQSLEDRDLEYVLQNGKEWPIERTVDECIYQNYSTGSSSLLAKLICDFCGDLRYLPFDNYRPWIQYLDSFRERNDAESKAK